MLHAPKLVLSIVSMIVLALSSESFAKEVQLEFKVVPNTPGIIEVALDTPPIPASTCHFEWDSSGATVEVGTEYGLSAL